MRGNYNTVDRNKRRRKKKESGLGESKGFLDHGLEDCKAKDGEAGGQALRQAIAQGQAQQATPTTAIKDIFGFIMELCCRAKVLIEAKGLWDMNN